MKIRYAFTQICALFLSIAIFSQTVDKTKDVGEIPHSITPSPNGALNYTIPIEIYPGKDGTQPNLQLVYNSQNLSQFSVLGLGWSLGGLSEISRCQLSNYYDDILYSSPISTEINAFSLDGLRLVNSSNPNYAYQTEQNHIYVKKNADYTKFEVYYPNGTIAYYGNSSHKYSYPITKLVDPLGNYIDYTYSISDNRFYIEQISYSSNQNIKIGEIKFSYATNDFERFAYIDAQLIKTTKRISKIDSYFGNTLLKSYIIDYKKDNNNYFLSKLDCTSSGKYLNPLTFEYGDGTTPTIVSESKTLPSGRSGCNVFGTIGVNWDSQSPNEGYAVLLEDPKTGWIGVDWISSERTPQSYPDGLVGEYFRALLVGDVDGDTNEDVVKVIENPNKKSSIHLSLISGPKTISKKYEYYIDIPIADNRRYLLGDFQGNGKAIIMVISYGKSTSGASRKTEIAFLDIENQKILHINKDYFTILPEDNLQLIDFDGDGAVELLHINQTGVKVYKVSPSGGYPVLAAFSFAYPSFRYNKLLIGDINNDGKTDLMFSPSTSTKSKRYVHSGTCYGCCEHTATTPEELERTGNFPVYMGPPGSQCRIIGVEDYLKEDGGNTWTVYFSNGKNAFTTSTFLHNKYYGNNYDDYILCDINNDGFLDLIKNSSVDKKFDIYYNKGGAFSTIADYTAQNEDGRLVTSKGSSRFGHNKGIAFVRSTTVSLIYNKNQENNSLLLSKSVSSLGATTKIEYGKVNSENFTSTTSVYNQSGILTYPWFYIPSSVALLKSINSSINNTTVSSQTYQYKNGLVHMLGLGFRGFEEVTSTDNIDNTRSKIQKFDPLNWSVLKSEESCPAQGNISYKLFQNSYQYTNTIASNKARVVTLKEKTEKDFLKNISTTTSYTYDTYGSPTKEIISLGDGIKKTTDFKYNNLTGSPYILGQLAEKTETNERNGSLSTTKSTLVYNTKGQLTSQKNYYEGLQVSEDTYTYDTQNNLYESKTKSYTAADELSTKYECDNIGRVKRKTDPLELYIDYAYNTKGELSSVKNHKGHETKYEYDIWGRKVKTTYPDSTVESLNMEWTSYDADLGDLDPNKNYGDIKIAAPLSQGTTLMACRSISLTPGFSHKAADKGSLILGIDPNVCSTPPSQTPYNVPLYFTTIKKTGSSTTQSHYDALGRTLREGELRFDGRYLYTDIVYDNKGRVQKKSLPFKGTAPTAWNTYNYDSYNRLTLLSYASGKKDSCYYINNSVKTIIDNVERTTNYDASGKTKSITDPAGTITYNFRADGELSSVVAPGDITTSFEYDSYGRQTKIIDPSAGTKLFAYDAAGNINQETDAEGRITKTTYDKYNRIISKNVVGELTTTYAYNTDGLLASISSNNGTGQTFTYDNLLRISAEKENGLDNKWLQKVYTYVNGNIASIAYKSNNGDIATENYTYSNGHMSETKLNNTTSIWKLSQENNLGMPLESKTGILTRTYGYDAYGLPTSRVIKNGSTVIQNFGYNFNATTGNLNWRKDNTRNIQENFTYDNLNRLTGFGGKSIVYDVKGNITDFATVGKFGYTNSAKPYAVTEITPYGTEIPLREQTITYNGMMRPSSITEDVYASALTYNANGDRVKMNIKKNNIDELVRYYIGGQYEMDSVASQTMQKLYLGGDAYSAAAVYVKEGAGAWTIYYIGRDYLGSITHLINTNGTIKQELSYDPWGRLRDPSNQQNYAIGSEPVLFLARGYTGHEHLPMFGLINMNARLYDPVSGRFLSPDPYVQAPDFSQNFNRYTYALNNPLRFTDPNGEFWQYVIGAVAGGIINWGFNGFKFNMEGLKYFGAGAVGGALIATGKPIGIISGAAFTAGSNSAISQYSANGFIDWWEVGTSTIVGGISAFLAYQFSGAITPYVESLFRNVTNEVLQKGLTYGTTGAITGVTVGGGMGYATTGEWDGAIDGMWKGAALGFGTGFAYGAGGQIYKNWGEGKNLWTGEYSNEPLPNINTRFVTTEDGSTYDMKPTMDRIQSGETYPHRNDGSVFENRIPRNQTKPLLPDRPLGTYKEYVVPPTPGMRGVGPLRIVTNGTNFWFTPDHYRTFIQIK